MGTNIHLDERLVRRAIQLTGLKTKRAVVHRGLELLVRLKEQEKIGRFRGKLRWRGDLAKSRES
jgi:Arc/MetJ family transcription regulator